MRVPDRGADQPAALAQSPELVFAIKPAENSHRSRFFSGISRS